MELVIHTVENPLEIIVTEIDTLSDFGKVKVSSKIPEKMNSNLRIKESLSNSRNVRVFLCFSSDPFGNEMFKMQPS